MRCFGRDEKIVDCNWEYLSSLQTLKEPRESMPRLIDILEYLASPGLEHIWLLLDLKVCSVKLHVCTQAESIRRSQVDNDPETLMRLIGETIRSVPANPQSPWNKRVVLGCWAVRISLLPWNLIRTILEYLFCGLRWLICVYNSSNISRSVPVTSQTSPSPTSASLPPMPAVFSPSLTFPLTCCRKPSSSPHALLVTHAASIDL